MSYELNRENLGDITRASHELLHRLTWHKCNIVGQAHEILAHTIKPSNEGSGEPAQMHILAIAFTARIHKV